MKPHFFQNANDFRKWLEDNHQKEQVLWVGFYKKHTQLPSITYSESVDQALCFGWIDGVRHPVDDKAYKIRFTPRKPKSYWSTINIQKVKELKKQDLMHPSGLKAFNKEDVERSIQEAKDREQLQLSEAFEKRLQSNKKVWAFFQSLTPAIKKQTVQWVMSAKQATTQSNRLQVLIDSCIEGKKIPMLRRKDEK